MKRILYLLICLLLGTFCACEGDKYPRALLVADSLSYASADSVLVLLKEMEGTMHDKPESVRKFYQLVRMKAEAKAHILPADDSLLTELVRYYEDEGNDRVLAEAYLLAGRVYVARNDSLRALQCFDKALDALVLSKDEAWGKVENRGNRDRNFLWEDLWMAGKKAYMDKYKREMAQADTVSAIYSLMNASFFCRIVDKRDTALMYNYRAQDLADCAEKDYLWDKAWAQANQVYMQNRRQESYQVLEYTYILQHLIDLVLLFAAVVFFICFYVNVRKRHRMQQEKLSQLQEELRLKSPDFMAKSELEQQALEKRMQETDAAGSAQKNELQLRRQELVYLQKRAAVELERRKEARQQLHETDIYIYFMDVCNGKSQGSAVPEEKWSELQRTVNALYQNMTERLLQIRKFSLYELRICLLIKIGVSPIKMAELTNHSAEAISSVRRRMYQKFFDEKGTPQQWDEFIDLL
ncbi:MAG: hypothetical protein Q4D56_04490 [Bacteroides sp.]|nr:hypothetical protein [Bacteroides sp.]